VQEQPRIAEETLEEIDEWFRNRVRMMQAVDESIAGLVRRLEERGQLDDTWIFFTSDNGFQQGAHRLDHGKGDAYDESIRVPLIVRGPGVPRNVRLPHMALNIDLAPTFAEIAGAELPEFVDGESLLPLLNAEPLPVEEWRSDFLLEHWGPEEGGITEYAALRSTDRLYVEYPGGERELYDLEADPGQLQSLHEKADPELLAWLSARLAALKECAGATCRTRPEPFEAEAEESGEKAPEAPGENLAPKKGEGKGDAAPRPGGAGAGGR
jgi:arylsulfatase A-like enzyme